MPLLLANQVLLERVLLLPYHVDPIKVVQALHLRGRETDMPTTQGASCTRAICREAVAYLLLADRRDVVVAPLRLLLEL